MEHAVDVGLVILCTGVFAALALAMIVPWRRPDRLTRALVGLFFTWAAIFGLAILQTFHLLPLLLPIWERWTVRACLIGFGVWAVIEMLRAGAFRRTGGGQ